MLKRAVAFIPVFLLANSIAASADQRQTRLPSPAPLSAAVAREANDAVPVNLWTLKEPKRPAMLPVLYASYATLQALDVVSTRKAIKAGARETNPLMNNGQLGTMIAVKAATGVSTMYIAEKLWKKNRVGAVIVMAAINGATAAVVAHNTRNVRR